MSKTRLTLPKPMADNAVAVGVPLVVIATMCAISGLSLGSLSAIAAAVLAAVMTTVFQFFGAGWVSRLSGDFAQGARFYVLTAGFNAVLTAVSMLLISATLGF